MLELGSFSLKMIDLSRKEVSHGSGLSRLITLYAIQYNT